MPNWIKNRLTIGSRVEEVLDFIIRPTWREWRRENCIKWSAGRDWFVSSNCIEFQTAHNNAAVSLERLSELFPDVVFEYAYADEDTGFNCGKGTIANGVSHMTIPSNESNKAYELSFELWPEEAKRFELIDGKYVYIED